MHTAIFFNGRIGSSSQAQIPAVSSASLYGKGVFTTIAIYNGKPFLWQKHWRRLHNHAAALGIDLSEYSEEAAREALRAVIIANTIIDGRARITFYDESASAVWPLESQRRTSMLIVSGDLRPVLETYRIEVSPFRIFSLSKTAGIKSCNYLDNLLAYEEAIRRGFHEAIRLNERGEITSGCMANVFWLEGERLFTPNLTTGCLAGTTREFILENLACEEVLAERERMKNADAVFLTSAGLGVRRVSELEGRKLAGDDHSILDLVPGGRP
jgi:branched-subunit amino acid aminotransferase/4-amino-4-deoxychorismate lyase